MNVMDIMKITAAYKRRRTVGKIIACIISIALVFLLGKLNAFAIVIALVALFIMLGDLGVRLDRKLISPILNNELDPEKYMTVIASIPILSPYALTNIWSAYYANEYQAVIDMCTAKLSDKNAKGYRIYYLCYLARIYFDTGDTENLRRVCDAFDAAVAESRKSAELAERFVIMRFFKLYLDGDHTACRQLYDSAIRNGKYTSTPLGELTVLSSYAIACYNCGDIETCRPIFERILTEAPKLNLAVIAKRYLDSIAQGEYIPDGRTLTPTAGFVMTPVPNHRRTLRIFFAVLTGLALVSVLLGEYPAEPAKAIAYDSDISYIVELVPLNEEGDALCVYVTKDSTYAIAYLDCLRPDRYICRLASEYIVPGYPYYITAEDSGLLIRYAMYEDKDVVPKHTYRTIPLETDDGELYLCIEEPINEPCSGYGVGIEH